MGLDEVIVVGIRISRLKIYRRSVKVDYYVAIRFYYKLCTPRCKIKY